MRPMPDSSTPISTPANSADLIPPREIADTAAGELQYRVIDALRFPLIVGVLLIHTRVLPVDATGGFHYLKTLFSDIIGHVSVPLFFFISGYLFFYKMEFSATSFLSKLKKRARTLLFPYVFWISTWIIAYYALEKMGFIWEATAFKRDFFIFHAFWDIEQDCEGTRPLVGQFWFLRDLMCAILISPLIYWAIRKLKCLFLVALGVLWVLEGQACGGGVRVPFVGERGLSLWVLFFFSAGVWFSMNKQIWITIFSRWQTLSFVTYPVLVVLDLFTRHQEWNWFIHRIGIFVGVFFFVNLMAMILSAKSKRGGGPSIVKHSPGGVGTFLVSASFFVYATHGPALLLALNKLIFVPLKPQTDWALVGCYFLFLILELAITLLIYWILRHFFPKFTCLVTGGRIA